MRTYRAAGQPKNRLLTLMMMMMSNKENNVFKDGIGVQGLRFKVVKLSSLIPWDLGHAEQLSFSCLWSKVISDVNISETVYPIYLKINMRRVASGDSLHINF